ncbi:MAG TPA: TIGR01777 family oxidoreductase [Candidatus Udaeobacter sp.]|jgi:uncharacterized protein (TIGR01777 family)|nr:TIGR01777 family oxidoreductase [Candidatus Udaeobacter sp.]
MKLVVAGASGFIGSALIPRLLENGHTLTLLTQSSPRDSSTPKKRWLYWTPGVAGDWQMAIEGADGVINLAGEPIAKRWSENQKRKIRHSRLKTTSSLIEAIGKAKEKPVFLLSASAVGYYGPRGDEIINEAAAPGKDFLASVCREWEAEAQKAESFGIRTIRLRTGVVLGRGGGALVKMVPPFKFFVGGPLGSGTQWMSWIHLEDEVSLILYLMENYEAAGPFNATAPNPVQMKEFCRTLGKVMGRPCWAPVPAFALRLMVGEMADMLLTGQRVIPAAAQKLGYEFRYPNLYNALRACMPL